MTVAVEPTIVHKPWPFRACPDCDGETFAAASVDHNVVFTCLGCHVSWRYVLGYLHRLDPVASEAADQATPAELRQAV